MVCDEHFMDVIIKQQKINVALKLRLDIAESSLRSLNDRVRVLEGEGGCHE